MVFKQSYTFAVKSKFRIVSIVETKYFRVRYYDDAFSWIFGKSISRSWFIPKFVELLKQTSLIMAPMQSKL